MKKSKEMIKIDDDNLMIKKFYSSPFIKGMKTEVYIKNIIDRAHVLTYYKGIFDATINLCLYHIMANHKEDANRQLQVAEQIISAYNLDDLAQLDLYRAYSIYYIEVTGDYRSGIQYSEFAMSLAVKNNLKSVQMRIKSNMAVINHALGFYDVAIEQLLETVHYYEINQDESHMMYDYFNIAETYYHLENYKASEAYFLKAIEISKTITNTSIQLDCIAGLARTYIKVGRKTEALNLINHPSLITDGQSSTKYELNLIIALAEIYASMGDCQKTFDLLIKYEAKARDVNNKSTLLDYYELLASSAGHLGEYKIAYDYMMLYKSLNKEVMNINSEQAMNEVIQTEYKKNLSQLETIASVGREIAMLNDLDNVILEVTNILSSTMSIDSIGIGRYQNGQIHFNHFYSEGSKMDYIAISIKDEASLAAWCIRNNKPLIVNDVDNDSRVYTTKPLIERMSHPEETAVKINAIMYTPLLVKNEVLGIFTIQSNQKFAYSKKDMEMFKIVSSYVAIALKNISQSEVLERLSITDTLTGLINRRGFTDFFEKNIYTSKSIGLLMIDLDFFKKINDTYGHIVGDFVLQEISSQLNSYQSDSICVARLGGEEFGILILNQPLSAIKTIAENIRKDIMEKVILKGKFSIGITVSIGIALESDASHVDYKELYHKADAALYQAKENGRNQIAVH